MKQNERWLVYAVTGFLALILVVALVFSPEAGKNPLKSGAGAQGLDEIMGTHKAPNGPKVETNSDVKAEVPVAGDPKAAPKHETVSGLPAPGTVAVETPLHMQAKPLSAADLVLQANGVSRVERGVRFVRALRGDTMDSLVKRWCGARDPFLDETKALNEELTSLRAGQEVAVPFVADEQLLLAIEASKPKTLTAEPVVNQPLAQVPPPAPTPTPTPNNGNGNLGKPVDATANRGNGATVNPVAKPESGKTTPVRGTSYTVKEKDSLWGIAAKTYGKKNADRMIPRIKEANPGLDEALRPGMKLVLPTADEATTPAKGGA